jgi:hypothetical protein
VKCQECGKQVYATQWLSEALYLVRLGLAEPDDDDTALDVELGLLLQQATAEHRPPPSNRSRRKTPRQRHRRRSDAADGAVLAGDFSPTRGAIKKVSPAELETDLDPSL